MTDALALPKYIQISERLIREIAAGHLADGARLPPERNMAERLGIAVGTLRKALADLEDKGLLERIQGSGNYVRHRPVIGAVYGFFRLELIGGGGLPTAEVLSVDRCAKPQGMPTFGLGAEGHRIRRLRLLDEKPVALEEIWLDGEHATQLDQAKISDSLYLYFREALGLVVASVEDRIGVQATPDWADAQFGPRAGDLVGYVERLGRTSDGQTIEYSRTWFDMNACRYVSRMGKG